LSIIISIVLANPTLLTLATDPPLAPPDGGELFYYFIVGDLFTFFPTNYDFLPEDPVDTLVELVFKGELDDEEKVCYFLLNLFLLS
jgi:hypothetical protein